MADSYGDQTKGQTAMENCLQKNPDINVVYTINEPTAAGAYTALKAAGKEKDVVIVSVDGGCQGIRDVGAGAIAATVAAIPAEDGGARRRRRRGVSSRRARSRAATPTPA